MTPNEFSTLYTLAIQGLSKTGWHWFAYHFHNGPRPFAMAIMEACASIDRKTSGIGSVLLKELVSIGGRVKDEKQYEQLIQKLSEILVIDRVVNCAWPQGTAFEHEPEAITGGPRPELLVTHPEGRLVVEVKTPGLLDHIRARHKNAVQLSYRGGVPLETAKSAAKGDVTLPRDNPVLDFLKDAERKFAVFRQDAHTASMLVIVWDDHIYEPISALVNGQSGLLTSKTYARGADNAPLGFPNIDCIVSLRHQNYFIYGSREANLEDRQHAMDFGDERALPNVSFDAEGGRPIPPMVFEALRAYDHNDPGLRAMAEYNPSDLIFWL